MGFLKKLVGVFGFGQEMVKNEEDDTGIDSGDGDNQPRFRETGLPRKGFGVLVQVAVERSHLGPVLQPCSAKDGGVQGLKWYTKRLRVDEDGDVADEFLEEGLTEKPTNAGEDDNCNKTMPCLQPKRKTTPAKVRRLVVSSDGKLKQCIEHQGRFLIVRNDFLDTEWLGHVLLLLFISISESLILLNYRRKPVVMIVD